MVSDTTALPSYCRDLLRIESTPNREEAIIRRILGEMRKPGYDAVHADEAGNMEGAALAATLSWAGCRCDPAARGDPRELCRWVNRQIEHGCLGAQRLGEPDQASLQDVARAAGLGLPEQGDHPFVRRQPWGSVGDLDLARVSSCRTPAGPPARTEPVPLPSRPPPSRAMERDADARWQTHHRRGSAQGIVHDIMSETRRRSTCAVSCSGGRTLAQNLALYLYAMSSPAPRRDGRGQGRTAPMTGPARGERPGAGPPPPASLLWPAGCGPRTGSGAPLTPEAVADLDLAPLLRALSGQDPRRERFVGGVLTALCTDPQILSYRAEVVDDLLADATLREALRDTLPDLEALGQERRLGPDAGPVQRIVQRLVALELFVDVTLSLSQALDRAAPRARALQALRATVKALAETPPFPALQADLPALRAQITAARGVTIGINLSDDLLPQSATILSLETERMEGRPGLLERLLGRAGGRAGLTPLRPGDGATDNALLRDLRRLLERVVAPVGEALERYTTIQTHILAGLGPELALLLHAAALIARVQRAGLPLCRPQVAPLAERSTAIAECYNLSLALRLLEQAEGPGDLAARVVTNTATLDSSGRVWILTGPNRGGKTTYTRAIGLAHVLAQAGLYVPGRAARLSPVDAIYTHFPAAERAQVGQGRLDDEAARLATIFAQATPHSLILLNEVLAGTSTVEALGLARDAVRGLHLLGARAIYVTHLHELALLVEEINAQTAGDGVVASVVAAGDEDGAEDGGPRRIYRMRRGPPRGRSYASEIAVEHGISFPQLEQLLRRRRLLPEGAPDGEATQARPGADQGERSTPA